MAHDLSNEVLSKAVCFDYWVFLFPVVRPQRIVSSSFFLTITRFTGIIPLVGYQVIIYQMLGSSAIKSLVLTIVYGVATTLGAVTCGFWLDKIGRRTALVSWAQRNQIPTMDMRTD